MKTIQVEVPLSKIVEAYSGMHPERVINMGWDGKTHNYIRVTVHGDGPVEGRRINFQFENSDRQKVEVDLSLFDLLNCENYKRMAALRGGYEE